MRRLTWIGIAALPPMVSNSEILPLALTLAGGALTCLHRSLTRR